MTALPSRKRRKISPQDDSSSSTLKGSPVEDSRPASANAFVKNAGKWDLEQDYQNRKRKAKQKDKESTRLPIKTAEGLVEQVEVVKEDDADSFLASEDEEGDTAEVEALNEVPKKSTKQQIAEAREDLARIGFSINEDPEEHISGLKTIAEYVKSPVGTIKRLALATQSAIFKDVIPGYRIRPLDEDSMTEKVSKEVRKLRGFEQTLVSSYQVYVRELAACARNSRGGVSPDAAQTATVAISCACLLLIAVPHFNFRGDLVKILVDKLSTRRKDADFDKCRTTLEQLFREDDDGKPSMEAVTMLCRMIKARDYHVDEGVLNTFLHLRLLSEFSGKASHENVDRPEALSKEERRAKNKKVFRTKKQRKAAKELKAVEKELREADAVVDYEEREKIQAETLKLVFAIYIRILKARSRALTGAVLEGLAKYAHLINQDYFGDLLIALQEIASSAVQAMAAVETEDSDEADTDGETSAVLSSPYRTALLCATTAFALLSSQDAASLHLDLSYFTNLLYTLLLPLSITPDLELSTKTLRLADPHDATTPPTIVNATTLSTLLVRALTATLTPRNTPPTRLAAFSHRLMLLSLHAPEKTDIAMVTLLQEIVKTQGRKVGALWNSEERRGDGRFDPLGDIEASKPFCGTVWEGEILRLHYAEGVRKGLGELEEMVGGLA